MEYHMGTFLKKTNHISRTVVKFELRFSGNIEVDRIFWFSSQYQVGLSVAVIMALSHRGMLRTRSSILSGVTAPQACNKASRNLATVVRGLSRSLSNSLIWSQICSMGFRSGLWAGHCMTLTPHPSSQPHPSRKKLYFVQYVELSCASTKFLWKVALSQEILVQHANVALLVHFAIHRHQLRFAWCMESTPYHEGGADISIHFLDATVN